ncbi:sporulation protein [Catenovulum agarivorans]|uniref:sporulation protein n=1 Tax=Catenovulum agarivorans TaxID=1172192 RepID=UPI0002FE6EB1|nr:sporulation protein [Catenovulum agarivorans]
MSLLKRIFGQLTSTERAASIHWNMEQRTYALGSDLSFSVEYNGGAVEQHIDNVDVTLICHLHEITGDVNAVQVKLVSCDIDRDFFIPARQKLKKFYSIHLPKFSPVTNEICRYSLELKLNRGSTATNSLSTEVKIGPSEQISTWLKVLAELDFHHQSHWNQPLNNSYGATQFVQKFRYRKSNFVDKKSLDLIFRFEQYNDYLDVFVEAYIANQAQFSHQTTNTFRFTIEHNTVDLYKSKLQEQLSQS